MIEPQAGIARPAIAVITPERELRIVGMHGADRISPTHVDKLGESRARRWLHQSVVGERSQRIDIEVSWHDVEVASKHRWHILM